MIAFSDNTATNLVLDKVGIAAVNKRMDEWGLKETRINAKVFLRSTSVDLERSKKYGLGSTTAREMAALFEELLNGERLRPAVKQAILGHLRHNEDKDKFTRLLPPGTKVLHKDGSVNEARTDAGVVYTPTGPVAVVVLTNGNADQRWQSDNAGNLLCARVARAVYDRFSRPAEPAKTDP
jgi:beta-lactamase class A